MELRGFLLDHDYSGSHLDDNGNITILSWNWKILCTQFKFWVKHGMMIWLLTGIQWWWSFFDMRKRKILRLLRCGNLLHHLLKMSFSNCTQKSLVDYFYASFCRFPITPVSIYLFIKQYLWIPWHLIYLPYVSVENSARCTKLSRQRWCFEKRVCSNCG